MNTHTNRKKRFVPIVVGHILLTLLYVVWSVPLVQPVYIVASLSAVLCGVHIWTNSTTLFGLSHAFADIGLELIVVVLLVVGPFAFTDGSSEGVLVLAGLAYPAATFAFTFWVLNRSDARAERDRHHAADLERKTGLKD